MKPKIMVVIVSLIALATISVGLIINFSHSSRIAPIASKGVLDLSEKDIKQNGPIKLNGEWEFVSGRLVDSEYFIAENNSTYVQVPSLWVKYKVNEERVPKYTNATYRLIVKLPKNQQLLGIKTGNIRMSNAIYIDGKKVGQSGIPSENNTYSPHNTPYVSFFQNESEEVEIIVHVANYEYASGGGIISSIYLGDADSILKQRQEALAYDWVMIAALLVVGIYFLGFYHHFKRDRSLLYLSLFCFSAVLYTSTHGEKILHNLYPNMYYGVFSKFQGSSNLISLFLLAYFHETLKFSSYKKVVQGLLVLGVILNLTIFLPLQVSSNLQIVYSIYLFVVLLYVLFIQMKAILKKTTGAAYLLISSLTLIVYAIVATLNVMIDIKMDSLPPIFPFVYLLMLSLYMANRFTDTYRKNEELNRKLIEVDQFKDEFLAKTSHEFKTPLHGMIAILQSMQNNSSTNKVSNNQVDKLHFVINQAKRLSSLVNDILDLAKLKRKELKVELKDVDLYSNTYVVSEVFSYMLQKDIQLINLISRDIPLVRADENRLRQILYNLIDNAIKYTNHGEIEISAYQESDQVILMIRDTGIGIAPEKLVGIFNAYEQGTNFKEEIHGVGLGLSITKQLVEIQGGQIWVESEVGKGSTFYIRFPAVEKAVSNLSLIQNDDYLKLENHSSFTFPFIHGNPNGKKIIIADDNHANLRVLIEALDPEVYSIFAVDNGADVLKQLDQNSDMDLIILDIMMPGLSGYEVCQKVREKYSLTELPVLMLTAAILPEDMVAAFNSGANDFLHKPIDITELKIRMNNLILIKESARAATNMEVAFLQAQIKPHFIYNVLNSIMSLSYLDIDKTRALIMQFANFLRGSFVFMNTNKLIPLSKEIALINSYVEIEKARFPNKFLFELNIDANLDCLIPPLVIQPIVENAIRHGVSAREKVGQVSLTITQNKKEMFIKITDNGNGMNQHQIDHILAQQHDNESGVGLLNIVKRIKQFYGATISIESEEDKGTTIQIVLPYLKEKFMTKEEVYVKSSHDR